VSITGIAYSVGFNDGSHFARMFRRFTGMLPSQYAEAQTVAPTQAAASGVDSGLRRRASDSSAAWVG
jgi:AraC-like DNA-binding protein